MHLQKSVLFATATARSAQERRDPSLVRSARRDTRLKLITLARIAVLLLGDGLAQQKLFMESVKIVKRNVVTAPHIPPTVLVVHPRRLIWLLTVSIRVPLGIIKAVMLAESAQKTVSPVS